MNWLTKKRWFRDGGMSLLDVVFISLIWGVLSLVPPLGHHPKVLICHWQVPLKTNYVLCSDGRTYPAPK